MTSVLTILLRLRLVALVLLAAIGLQAAAPAQAGPLVREEGPAWSAFTLDVALAPARKAHVEAASLAPFDPVLPPAPAIVAPAGFASARACAHPAFTRPHTRGPPPRLHPARVPDCMAPPLS